MIEREQGGRLRYGRQLWDRARRVLPGGVNSNVKMDERPQPLYFVRAEGSRLVDCDGNSYIDYTCGFGPVILGHAYPSVVHAIQQAAAQGLLYGGQHEAEVQLAAAHPGKVAAVLMEPIMCNSGVIFPETGYLQGVRDVCRRQGIVLIFDEVITGFRVHLGGAQALLNVVPDLAVFGKAMANGFRIGCVGGRREVLDLAASSVVHAGTFNGHPVGVAAALATLREVSSRAEEIYAHLTALGSRLMHGIRQIAAAKNIPVLLQRPGAVFYMWFTPAPAVHDYATSARIDRAPYARFAEAMLAAGVRLIPGGRWYVSFSHTDADVSRTLDAVAGALDEAVR